jgi:predicted TIM-barrel fold metal-dependent hydrolase
MRFPVIDCLFDATSGRNAAEAEFSKSLRCFPAAGELLPAMDRAGVRQALVTQCKRWSCERQWLCVDMRVQDVLSLVRPAPDRLAGLAGYNPHAIMESLHEIDEAAASGGFRGIYLNAENFGVTLVDNRVYPLYAKAASLRWPVMVQFGINWKSVAYASTFADLLHVAGDFPELTLVAAGVDPVHLGIVLTVNTAIGMFTPPFGLNLFAAVGVANQSILKISKAVLPFILVSIIALLIVTYVPAVSMFLPNLLGGK